MSNIPLCWARVGRWSALVLPFVQPGDRIPALPAGIWIGRVISDVFPGKSVNLEDACSMAWVCRDVEYGLEALHVKARNQVRKAIKAGAIVERIGWDVAYEILPDLVADTFVRQRRNTADHFLQRLEYLRNIDNNCWQGKVEIWVAKLPDGTVGSLLLGLQDRSSYYILHQLSKTSQLDWCPNNLLTFSVTQGALLERGCKQVNYGVDGLDSGRLDGLARFKQRMGYVLLPCSERYVASRALLVLLGAASFMARVLLRIWSGVGRFDIVRQIANIGSRLK